MSARCRWLVIAAGWIVLCVLHGSLCLKITETQIPRYLVKGGQVALRCKYDAEGSELYAVKWYKNSQEFYRFMPQSSEPKRAYNVAGFSVILDKSTDSEVALDKIGDQAAGTYKCEISCEGPHFWTAYRERNVSVAALPERQPEIWGHQHSYRPGEDVSINCTAHNSSPPAHVNWFVNGEQVPRESIRRRMRPTGDGLMTASAGLRFTARRHHFKTGVMQLKCAAMLGDVYWESAQVELPLWTEDGPNTGGGRSSGTGAVATTDRHLSTVLLVTLLVTMTPRLC
ncbi:uncharacterized protein LOC119112718 [Pollicipes pollicipes]|uniref:uncharacterized protein LOC119112718 n=1 Tax=Pollicipes pollicipes TaxID=41117 RepID=UPI001884F8D6|nr:uncharacterized protein LOC119112718 [Pollicipes pollicipes]